MAYPLSLSLQIADISFTLEDEEVEQVCCHYAVAACCLILQVACTEAVSDVGPNYAPPHPEECECMQYTSSMPLQHAIAAGAGSDLHEPAGQQCCQNRDTVRLGLQSGHK